MPSNGETDVVARNLRDVLARFDTDDRRVMLRVLRRLAEGRPVAPEEADQIAADLGIAQDKARRTLALTTERDGEGQIRGLMGLSLNDHLHQLTIAGRPLAAWCALDTLFLPILLRQAVEVASPSRVSRRPVHLRVSAEGVEALDPNDAVMSLVLVDPDHFDTSSVEAVWNAFCTLVHFFATRDEAEGWAHGHEGIAIVDVREGYELARAVWGDFLAGEA